MVKSKAAWFNCLLKPFSFKILRVGFNLNLVKIYLPIHSMSLSQVLRQVATSQLEHMSSPSKTWKKGCTSTQSLGSPEMIFKTRYQTRNITLLVSYALAHPRTVTSKLCRLSSRRHLLCGLDSHQGSAYISMSSFFNLCFLWAKINNLKSSLGGKLIF